MGGAEGISNIEFRLMNDEVWCVGRACAPRVIPTPNPQLRRLMLYPFSM